MLYPTVDPPSLCGCRREQEQRMVHGIVLSYNQESDLHQV